MAVRRSRRFVIRHSILIRHSDLEIRRSSTIVGPVQRFPFRLANKRISATTGTDGDIEQGTGRSRDQGAGDSEGKT
ncbi:MAG: hypothetical protein SGJ19_24635 [Planctomycetia bacterium]|nr:hypothetical protein [Planctomycetia bacterium]